MIDAVNEAIFSTRTNLGAMATAARETANRAANGLDWVCKRIKGHTNKDSCVSRSLLSHDGNYNPCTECSMAKVWSKDMPAKAKTAPSIKQSEVLPESQTKPTAPLELEGVRWWKAMVKSKPPLISISRDYITLGKYFLAAHPFALEATHIHLGFMAKQNALIIQLTKDPIPGQAIVLQKLLLGRRKSCMIRKWADLGVKLGKAKQLPFEQLEGNIFKVRLG